MGLEIPDYVILPCDTLENQPNKWNYICSILNQPINKLEDLFEMIQKVKFDSKKDGYSYLNNFDEISMNYKKSDMSKSKNKTSNDLKGLYNLINFWLRDKEKLEWRLNAIRIIQQEALKLPFYFSGRKIPLLFQLHPDVESPLLKNEIILTRREILSLLANAFFCTFPFRSAFEEIDIYNKFPSINFCTLYNHESKVDISIYSEKLNCIFAYFHRATKLNDSQLNEKVSFIRQGTFFNWLRPKELLSNVTFLHNIGMEDFDNYEVSKVDFANKYIGGGTLRSGCVQEEIHFLTNTECIISLLFFEYMIEDESIHILNALTFSKFTGYSKTFKWNSDLPTVSRNYDLIAIDAISYKGKKSYTQYMSKYVVSEITKCFSGFYPLKQSNPILTGNWGCGVFQGDPQFKFAIQLLAASNIGRDLIYLTYNDYRMKDAEKIYNLLKNNNITVEKLAKLIESFNSQKKNRENLEFFQYILENLQ